MNGSVAVGTALAGGPPLRSVLALLAHTAPALDNGGKPLFWPGMQNSRSGQHRIGYFLHTVPGEPALLASPPESSIPHASDLGPKCP